MARMIPQRKSPPYLLIIMSFLFLVSTGLAVKMYMDRDKAVKQTQEDKRVMKVVISRDNMIYEVAQYVEGRDAKDGTTREEEEKIKLDIKARYDGYAMVALCDMFEELARKRKADGTTVVSRLNGQVDDLIWDIVGTRGSHRKATREVKLVRAEMKDKLDRSMGGLVNEVRRLMAQVIQLGGKDGSGGRIGELEKEKTAETEKAKTMEKDLEALIATHRDEITAKNDRIKAEADRFRAEVKTVSDARDKDRGDYATKRDALNASIQKKTLETDKLGMDLRTSETKVAVRDTQIVQLKDKIAVLERKRTVGTPLVQKISPDGAIMSDPDRNRYCYINIGANDGVRRDWTFAVYAQGPITRATRNKGALVVMRVLPDVSECRLTKDVGGEVAAIAKGDLIANLAFDRNRTYTFVVEGVFDLHGTGRATLAGASAVKALIRNYGGKVVDQVVVNTDYVVLGQELPKPVDPGPDAPLQVRRAYEENLKIWQRYNDVKKQAMELRIPVLNCNRFLDYIGQMPEKRLEYSD